MWQSLIHRYLRMPYLLGNETLQSPAKPVATILLLHGMGSSLGMWRPLVKKFPDNVRVIAIDLLGFGSSPKPTWNTYGAKTQADSVATTLFGMKTNGPVVVVGHSLGSLIAIEFARRYPRMTKSLVLVSPPLYKPHRGPKRFDFKPEEILRRMYELMSDNPAATERVLRLAGKYRLLNKGFSAENVDVPAYLASLEAAIINQQSYRDILKITLPIHIISGQLDAIVLDETIKDIVARRPNIQWKRVLGGHEIVGFMRATFTRTIKTAIREATQTDTPSTAARHYLPLLGL